MRRGRGRHRGGARGAFDAHGRRRAPARDRSPARSARSKSSPRRPKGWRARASAPRPRTSRRRREAEKLHGRDRVARAHLDALYAEREARARELVARRAPSVAATAAEHARVRDEAARVRHRLDTLAEIDTQHSLYSQRRPAHLLARRDGDAAERLPRHRARSPTCCASSRTGSAPSRACFGTYLQSVIVPTPDDAVRAAAWLEATNAGRATFLVAGLHGGAESDESTSVEQVERTRRRDGAPQHVASTRASVDGGDDETARRRTCSARRARSAPCLRRTLAREMNARVVARSRTGDARLTLPAGEMCVTAGGRVGRRRPAHRGGRAARVGRGRGAARLQARDARAWSARRSDSKPTSSSPTRRRRRARARLGELEDAFVLLNDEIGREEREHVAREVSAAQLAAGDRARRAPHARRRRRRRAARRRAARARGAARATDRGDRGRRKPRASPRRRAVAAAAEALAAARRAAEAESENLGAQRAPAAAAAERRRAAAAELRRMESETGRASRRGSNGTRRKSPRCSARLEAPAPLARRAGRVGGGRVEGERAALERGRRGGRARDSRRRASAPTRCRSK